jgi:hypothetical protein
MFIVALASLGSVGLWFGLRAPAEKADAASQLICIGCSSWGCAIIVWGLKRRAEWFLA